MATGRMNNTEKIPFSLDPKDINGNAQPIENLQGVALNGADLTFEINPDGVSGFVVSGSTLGTFDIELRADAQIGDGEVILVDSHQIIVDNPQATTLNSTFGTPIPK